MDSLSNMMKRMAPGAENTADGQEALDIHAGRLLVYGAACVWWDVIDKVAKNLAGLPCCPKCRSVLYQVDPAVFWDQAREWEAKDHVGYRDFIAWQRGRCFKTHEDAIHAWRLTFPPGSIHALPASEAP